MGLQDAAPLAQLFPLIISFHGNLVLVKLFLKSLIKTAKSLNNLPYCQKLVLVEIARVSDSWENGTHACM